MLKASCQCGSLTVHSENGADFAVACACKACQARTGAAFGVGAYVRRAGTRIEGSSSTYARTADSGRHLTQHFCPTCGTTLFWELEMRPDHLGVAFGCLEEGQITPSRAIWLAEAHDWVRFPDDWPRFDGPTPE